MTLYEGAVLTAAIFATINMPLIFGQLLSIASSAMDARQSARELIEETRSLRRAIENETRALRRAIENDRRGT